MYLDGAVVLNALRQQEMCKAMNAFKILKQPPIHTITYKENMSHPERADSICQTNTNVKGKRKLNKKT